MSSYVPPHKRRGRNKGGIAIDKKSCGGSSPTKKEEQSEGSHGENSEIHKSDNKSIGSRTCLTDQEKRNRRQARFATNAKPDTSYGLVSRGEDTRLQNDRKAQEEFFEQIQRDFVQYCKSKALSYECSEIVDLKENSSSNLVVLDLERILMSLRKVREALLKAKCDKFVLRVFLFAVRAAALVGDYKSYQPACLHLLYKLHPQIPLPKTALIQIVSLHAYHLIHFSKHYTEAALVLQEFLPLERRPWLVARAVVTKDVVSWNYLVSAEPDRLVKHFLEKWRVPIFKSPTLHAISKSYMSIGEPFAEWLLGSSISETNWRVESGTVIVRERSAIQPRKH